MIVIYAIAVPLVFLGTRTIRKGSSVGVNAKAVKNTPGICDRAAQMAAGTALEAPRQHLLLPPTSQGSIDLYQELKLPKLRLRERKPS